MNIRTCHGYCIEQLLSNGLSNSTGYNCFLHQENTSPLYRCITMKWVNGLVRLSEVKWPSICTIQKVASFLEQQQNCFFFFYESLDIRHFIRISEFLKYTAPIYNAVHRTYGDTMYVYKLVPRMQTTIRNENLMIYMLLRQKALFKTRKVSFLRSLFYTK